MSRAKLWFTYIKDLHGSKTFVRFPPILIGFGDNETNLILSILSKERTMEKAKVRLRVF
jgi:hypothetical protein